MKVLYIPSDNSPTSGAFLSMVTLIKLLRENYAVEPFVVLPREGNGKALLEEEKIPFEIVRSYDWVVPQEKHGTFTCWVKKILKQVINFGAIRKIIKIANREGIDLIHINTTYAYIGEKVAKKMNIPSIWHIREFVEEDQGRTLWDRKKGNELISKADRIIAISSSVFEKYKNVVPNEKLVTILNGIDCNRFYHPEKKIFQNEKPIFVYGGGYAKRKGIYEFASAMQLLVEMGINNFEIWFIGDPNEKYIEYLRKIGLMPYIKILGYQKDVSQWYEKADIAFSCSKAEAFGRKTVEAMLCGTLMIASDTGGTLDLIFDKENGLLYHQGNPIDLAFKVIYALNHKEKCQQMAQAGRDFALRNLSARLNASKVYEQYESVLCSISEGHK